MRNTPIIVPWKEPPKGTVFLTKCQTEILRGIGEGKTVKEIAYDLNLNQSAVHNRIYSLAKKLNVKREHPLMPVALRVFGK